MLNKKPTGVQKGSQTIGAKNDKKGAGPKGPTPSQKATIMSKVMKAYPQGPSNAADAVIAANEAARNLGKPISQQGRRKLKFIGA